MLARLLADPALALGPEEQRALADEIRCVEMPELAEAFGPNSRAEVPLAGVVGGQAVFGQIDRLAISATEVLIVDYKTDREPPARPIRCRSPIFGRWPPIGPCCAGSTRARGTLRLLWTAGPRLMMLDEATLAGYAPVDAPA